MLLAKLAGAMQASLQNAVSLFAAPLAQTARVIEALRQKAEQDPSVLAGGAGTQAAASSRAAASPTEEAEPRARRGGTPPSAGRDQRADRPDPASQRLGPHHRAWPDRTGRTATMAKLSTDELLDAFKEMTLIELSEFVKQFEDTFGVTAAAPVAVAAAPAAGGGAAVPPRPAASRTSSTSSSRPPATRRSRSSRRCARSPAWASRRPRTWSTARPKPVLEKVNKEAADKAKAALEGAGATVTVK